MAQALLHQLEDPEECKKCRSQCLCSVSRLADVTLPENALILALLVSLLVTIVSPRTVASLRELAYLTAYHHLLFLPDLVLGSPMAGWACHVPTMRARTRATSCSIADLLVDGHAHNAKYNAV